MINPETQGQEILQWIGTMVEGCTQHEEMPKTKRHQTTYFKTNKEKDRQRERQSERKKRERQSERQTERKTKRKTDKQKKDRQRERQGERQTEIGRQREIQTE